MCLMEKGNSQREKENLDEEWNRIPESLLKSILNVHSQLFGSGLLKESVSYFGLSDNYLSHFLCLMYW